MLIKNTIKTEVSCEDGTRYYLKIEWNKDLPCAMVVMLTAGQPDGICFDRSTNLCLNNLIRFGYGSCQNSLLLHMRKNLRRTVVLALKNT